jgi:hypothetical protein
VIQRERLVFFNNKQRDPLSELEISRLLTELNTLLANVKAMSPNPEKTSNELIRAFEILFSSQKDASHLNPMKTFFTGTLGKQVLKLLFYKGEENPAYIAQILHQLWVENKLNEATIYFFNEMIRNGVKEQKALYIIKNIDQPCYEKDWLVPRLKEEINDYLQNPQAFITKVELAVEKGRKRGGLHQKALRQHGEPLNQYPFLMQPYFIPLESADFQDINGKTPLHYAVERADASRFVLANILLANTSGYSTVNTKDDNGKTPRDVVNEMKDGKVKEKFIELFNVADKRQSILLISKELFEHLGSSSKGNKVKEIMGEIQNATTQEQLTSSVNKLKKACKERRTFNFSIFENFRETPKSLQILNRALEGESPLTHREDTESKKAPGNKAGG